MSQAKGIPQCEFDAICHQQVVNIPCSLVIRPPYLLASDIGVVAFDITFGEIDGIPDQAPVICLGGHPAAECLLDVDGSGRDHRAVVAIDRSSLSHTLFVERLRTVFDPSIDLQITDRSTSR